MSEKTFADYEKDGWQRNAAAYDEVVIPATSQSIAPLLDSVGDLQGLRVLELASGTGHLAEQAVARGATVVGIDVAANMVELARKRVPSATFYEGAAEEMPFEDESFNVVLCCLSFLHFAQPEKAFSEVARVLKPGAPCAFTVWQKPEKGNEFLGLLLKTYQEHAEMDVGLPPAPPMFALVDPAVRDPMLTKES